MAFLGQLCPFILLTVYGYFHVTKMLRSHVAIEISIWPISLKCLLFVSLRKGILISDLSGYLLPGQPQ